MKQVVKEGSILKNYLKGTGKKLEEYAVELGFTTRQGLDYHLQKPKLDANFLKTLKDKLGIDFTNVKEDVLLPSDKTKIEPNSKGLSEEKIYSLDELTNYMDKVITEDNVDEQEKKMQQIQEQMLLHSLGPLGEFLRQLRKDVDELKRR